LKVVKLDTEEEAWALLQEYLENPPESDPDDPTLFDFGKWLGVSVHLPNTPIDGSISPTMMEAFIALQESIYRTYGLVSWESPDLRYLTNEKKDTLEFRVQVEKGSSDYEVDLSSIIEKIGIEVVSKMDPKMLAITIIGLALIAGSAWAFRGWLANRAEIRKAELDNEARITELEVMKSAITQNSENMKLLASAIKQQPVLADVDAAMEPARQHLVQSIARDGGGTLLDTMIDPSLASELKGQKRQQSEELSIAGSFSVVKVDATSPDGFRVTLQGSGYEHEITASLVDALVSADHREAIQKAEWSKTPVYIEMRAKKLRDKIFDAVVTLAKLPVDPN
jgi:hypothetical protein